ncbi:MAG TPA: hypothetical protein PKC03_15275 [Dokdonella sp.]|nr:hypothetical protein [Dokdonella sp.]
MATELPDLDVDPCFEIGARLSGALALLDQSEHSDTDDLLLYARRLVRDALQITTQYAKVVDEFTSAVGHAEHLREQEA